MLNVSRTDSLLKLVMTSLFTIAAVPTLSACTQYDALLGKSDETRSDALASEDGSIQLTADVPKSFALAAADVTSVTVTITGPGIAQPLTHNLVLSSGAWQGTIGGIPNGANRQIDVQAKNSANAVIYQGSVSSLLIQPNQTLPISLTLQDTNPAAPFGNAAPIMDSVVASQIEVAPGQPITVVATGHDPNPGDTVSYQWFCSGVDLSCVVAGNTLTFSATSEGDYYIQAVVADNHLARASKGMTLRVRNSRSQGSATFSTSLNTFPVVHAIESYTAQLDIGAVNAFSAGASDADGDSLSYTWTTTCTGTFEDYDGPNNQQIWFVLSERALDDLCSINVSVDDGRGGTSAGLLLVSTTPSPRVEFAPTIESTFQSLLTAGAAQSVQFSVTASDAYNAALTFDWTTTAGTAGAISTNGNTSEYSITTPACGPATVTVSVQNPDGQSSTHQFTVEGPACP
jgi:hypothetical protein